MKKISLLIVIPTYQRTEYLEEQLRRLELSIKEYSNIVLVDVLVRENSYTSFTREMVISYNFRYVSNHVNLGADFNFILCFLDAMEYDYLWILSDDDFIVSESFNKLMQEIIDADNDLIILSEKRSIADCEFNNLNILKYFELGTGLISKAVYRLDAIKPFFQGLMKYWYTGFPHLAIQLYYIYGTTNPKIMVISESNFDNPPTRTMPDSLGYNKSLYGYIGLLKILDIKSRRELTKRWWNDFHLRFKAVYLRKLMNDEYKLWFLNIKSNLIFFYIRFFFFRIFIYPLIFLIVVKFRNSFLTNYLRTVYISRNRL